MTLVFDFAISNVLPNNRPATNPKSIPTVAKLQDRGSKQNYLPEDPERPGLNSQIIDLVEMNIQKSQP